jgi:predicted MFS family arabinose efflux permease
VGLALVPSAVIGLLAAQAAGWVLQRMGAPGTLASAALLAAVSLLAAAQAVHSGWPVVLAAAVAGVTVSFSIGQPAMVWAVGEAVPSTVRGIALGVATLVFLVGGSLGAAAVGGLADTMGTPVALSAVAVLPVVGATVVLWAGRRRTGPGRT